MENEYFKCRTSCELIIVSNEITPDKITEILAIVPNRYFNKGDEKTSKYSDSIMIRPHNLWAIKSLPFESIEETISNHIEYFKKIFHSKMDLIQSLKNDSKFRISFWIWIETDNSGIGFQLNEMELKFINRICNEVRFSLITK